jgi:hypothetical protein
MRKVLFTLLILTSIIVGSGCQAVLRDAAWDGISAFVSDTISQSLEALFPLAQILQPPTDSQSL